MKNYFQVSLRFPKSQHVLHYGSEGLVRGAQLQHTPELSLHFMAVSTTVTFAPGHYLGSPETIF